MHVTFNQPLPCSCFLPLFLEPILDSSSSPPFFLDATSPFLPVCPPFFLVSPCFPPFFFAVYDVPGGTPDMGRTSFFLTDSTCSKERTQDTSFGTR